MCYNISENLQLAKTTEMKDVLFPARAELKLDDVRVMLLDNRFYSRSGKEYNLPETKKKLVNTTGHMIDLAVTLESGKMVDRPTVSGMLNSAMKGGTIDESLLWFNVIDTLPSDMYHSKTSLLQYRNRLASIEVLQALNMEAQFRKIPYRDVHNLDSLQRYYSEVLEQGYEGLIVKHYEDYYSFKRSKHWARFKEVKTADLACIYVNLGKGKYENMTGALVLKGVVEGKEVVVKVGSGMTDADREIDDYIGKTIEIKYNSVTQDKTTGQYSLFLPRFVAVRIDK